MLVLVFILVICAAPQTKTQKRATYGAVGGAVAGAIIGQVIGGHTEIPCGEQRLGVNISRIQPVGLGETMPVATNDAKRAAS